MKLNNRTLRQLFITNINASITSSRRECPSPKELLRLFRAKKSDKKNTRIIDHIATCYPCTQEFRFILKALRYEKDMNQVAKEYIETRKMKVMPPRFSWKFVSLVAGMSVIFISILAFVVSNTFEYSKYRTSTPSRINLILPEEISIPKSDLSFRWENIKDSEYYSLELYDETLYQIWKSKKIFENYFTLPIDVVARLKANKSYFWMISAFFPDGRKIASQLEEIFLAE